MISFLIFSWKPKGQLVAHLHEHKAAVNRYNLNFVGYDSICFLVLLVLNDT